MVAPEALIDALTSLLDAETNSIFRLMAAGQPYLDKATDDLKRPLRHMAGTIDGRVAKLAKEVERLGAKATPPPVKVEQQYLSFLSVRFLVPKLTEAKQLLIERYDNALSTADLPTGTQKVLAGLKKDHEGELTTLQSLANVKAS